VTVTGTSGVTGITDVPGVVGTTDGETVGDGVVLGTLAVGDSVPWEQATDAIAVPNSRTARRTR
jgi:hypothetical protein